MTTERIRTTISITPEAYEIFKRMAAAANSSVSRAMGDWLTDTADAATMITLKMEEAKSAPVRVMRELQAMVAGMSLEVDSIIEGVRTDQKEQRQVRHAQRGGPVVAVSPPSSNTGGKSPTPTPAALDGVEWWNSINEEDRAMWMRRSGSAVPADAWAAFKRATKSKGSKK